MENLRKRIAELEALKIGLMAKMRESDGRASKCEKLGLSFKESYSEEYVGYLKANEEYNATEMELTGLYKALEEMENKQESKPLEP